MSDTVLPPPEADAENQQQLVELAPPKSPANDWSGVSNSRERRKIQNRLAQRAYRQRKTRKDNLKIRFFHPSDDSDNAEALTKKHVFRKHPVTSEAEAAAAAPPPEGGDLPAAGEDVSKDILVLNPASNDAQMLEPTLDEEMLYANISDREPEPSLPGALDDFRVSVDHQYIDLIYYNVFRALEVNTGSIGLTTQLLKLDILSPFNTISLGGSVSENFEEGALIPPVSDPTLNLPLSLLPTVVQITVPHHPYLDIFPSPQVRDNLILAGDALDEDELCMDIMGMGHRAAGLVVWGDPWDAAGWELMEDFAKKWAWVIVGADDLLEGTNYWRAMRGLENLDLGA